jgi:hypothetical protein
MSRETEKFLKQLTQQIKSQNLETEAELQAFLEQMNSHGFENTKTFQRCQGDEWCRRDV